MTDWEAYAAYIARGTEEQKAMQGLAEALRLAVQQGEYVVKLVEATHNAGQSPNPFEKADWIGTTASCYAAMSFLNEARAALKAAKPFLEEK